MPEGDPPGPEDMPGGEPPEPPGPLEAEQLQSVTVTVFTTVEGDPGKGTELPEPGAEGLGAELAGPVSAGAVPAGVPGGGVPAGTPAEGVDSPLEPEGAPVGPSEPGAAE